MFGKYGYPLKPYFKSVRTSFDIAQKELNREDKMKKNEERSGYVRTTGHRVSEERSQEISKSFNIYVMQRLSADLEALAKKIRKDLEREQ